MFGMKVKTAVESHPAISPRVVRRVKTISTNQLLSSVESLLYEIGSGAVNSDPGDPRFNDATDAAEALWAVMLEIRRRR